MLKRPWRQLPRHRDLFSAVVRRDEQTSNALVDSIKYQAYRQRTERINYTHRSRFGTATDQVQFSRRLSEHSISDPTIYALSTASGQAGIAVIRISGQEALKVYHHLCPGRQDPKPRYATVRSIYEPHEEPSITSLLDSSALVLWFPGPRTVTGEDVLELHVHGGPAIVKSVLKAISKCASIPGSVRYAEAGEFTRRAFFNDRLDLTQVEALGDSLSAVTEQQRRIAVRGTISQLGKTYEQWRQMLLAARGELEALIDFSEDQHFDESPSELISNVAKQVRSLQTALETHTQNAVRGELLRNGISISLLGAPNAGKSSLLNRIIGREAAIVSHEAGTTRDVVEVSIDIAGYLCRFGDTAGLRRALKLPLTTDGETTANEIGIVEREGIRRAKARAAESDLVIIVLSLETDSITGEVGLALDPEVVETGENILRGNDNVVVAINKMDRRAADLDQLAITKLIRKAMPSVKEKSISFISCVATDESPNNSTGIKDLLSVLVAEFENMTRAVTSEYGSQHSEIDESIWQESLGATERQRFLLQDCSAHLACFTDMACSPKPDGEPDDVVATDASVDFVLAAEHLRNAAGCLAKITGRGESGDVEEVLGVVFEKFCVGK